MSCLSWGSTDEIYEVLESSRTFEERLAFFRTTPIDIRLENQPDAMLNRFYRDFIGEGGGEVYNYDQVNVGIDVVVDDAKVRAVGLAFKERFGEFVMCREASYCSAKFETLIDVLGDFDDEMNRAIVPILLGIGLKPASESTWWALSTEYCACSACQPNLCKAILGDYPYASIKKARTGIRREIIERVYGGVLGEVVPGPSEILAGVLAFL